MRRYSFFIGAASAVLTFVALSAFTGRRPWHREGRWPYGWYRHGCGRDDRDRDHRYRDDRFENYHDKDAAPLRDDRSRTTPIDSNTREFRPAPDSFMNR